MWACAQDIAFAAGTPSLFTVRSHFIGQNPLLIKCKITEWRYVLWLPRVRKISHVQLRVCETVSASGSHFMSCFAQFRVRFVLSKGGITPADSWIGSKMCWPALFSRHINHCTASGDCTEFTSHKQTSEATLQTNFSAAFPLVKGSRKCWSRKLYSFALLLRKFHLRITDKLLDVAEWGRKKKLLVNSQRWKGKWL